MSGQRWDHWAPEPPEARAEDDDPLPTTRDPRGWFDHIGFADTPAGPLVIAVFGFERK